jgi:hypothetical protein
MFVLISLWSIAFQPQNNVNGYDGTFYRNTAQQITAAQPITGPLPWIYRVGTPFLAATFSPLTGGDLVSSFKLINIAASALTTLLLTIYLRRHVGSVYARLIVMFLFLTQWHAPVRFAYFYPTSVDFWLMVFILLALLISDKIRETVGAQHDGVENVKPLTPNPPTPFPRLRLEGGEGLNTPDLKPLPEVGAGVGVGLDIAKVFKHLPLQNKYLWIALLSVVIFVGVLFREVMALFGVTALLITNPFQWSRNPTYIRGVKLPNPAFLLPLLAAVGGFMLIRVLVTVNQEGYPYTFDGTIYLWLYDKRLMTYLLAWFVAFGPVLALVLYNWRRGAVWLAQRQDVVVFVLALVVLAWVGGTDTERFLYWGMPIFYVLLGKALEDHAAWLKRSPILLLVLVVTQMLTQRFLLPTPDFNPIVVPQITPMLTILGSDTSFEHLQTFYSTLRWQNFSFALTIQHLVLAAVLIFWISIRAGRFENTMTHTKK